MTDSSRSASMADQPYRVRGVVFCLTLLFCPLAYSLHLTSFLIAKEAILGVGLCAMAGALLWTQRLSDAGFRAFLPLWTMLALSALVHLLLGRAHVRSDAVTEVVRWVTLLLAAAMAYDLLAEERWRTHIVDSIIVSAVLAAVLGIGQYTHLLDGMFPVYAWYTQRVYSVFGNQDLFGGYLAIAIPMLLGRRTAYGRMWPIWALALGILCFALFLSASRSAWLAAVAGVVALPFMANVNRSRWVTAAGIVGLTLVIAIFVSPQATVSRITNTFQRGDHGAQLRLWFWDGTLRMIRDHPLVGVGPGNYAYWSPQYLGEALHAANPDKYDHNELLVDHPHSEPLGVLAEFGVLGGLCAGWMLIRLARCGRGVEWCGLLALLVFAMFNAPFHSAPHALAGLVLSAILLQNRKIGGRDRPAWWFSATAAFCMVFFVGAVLLPSAWLRAAEDVHLAGRPPFKYYARCTLYPWPNATADLKCGIAFLDAGRYSEARRSFLKAMSGMDTGELYLAFALLEARCGAVSRAKEWLEPCFWRWPSSRDAWFLLASISSNDERVEVYRKASVWLTAAEMDKLKSDLAGR